jgi:RNA polymerase sigma-70 factor (ECF subfamily)
MSGRFETTRWSMILAAGKAGDDGAREALARLCETYWYPLYAHARRKGNPPEVAEDLTQGFFAELLEKGWVGAADPQRGRFRTFLLTAFRRHLSRARDRDGAKKRGGDRRRLSLDFEDGERRYSLEPVHDLTAERVFDRRWALTLLDRVLGLLRERMEECGRERQFAALRPFLPGGGEGRPYAEIAGELGLTEGAVKVAVHRLRARYRDLLRAEIGETVEDPGRVDDEIRDLMAALAGRCAGEAP